MVCQDLFAILRVVSPTSRRRTSSSAEPGNEDGVAIGGGDGRDGADVARARVALWSRRGR